MAFLAFAVVHLPAHILAAYPASSECAEMVSASMQRNNTVTAITTAHGVDVRRLRLQLGMSQPGFAARFKINLGTLRQWEQGRYQPDGAARVLLMVIAHDPAIVDQALQNYDTACAVRC